jgi:outer membrane lipoprotein SlyB
MANEQHEQIGSIAGLAAGMLTGARIGTICIPIPIVGTFAGALVGGVLGSEVGRTVGSAILDGIDAFAASLSQPRGPATTGSEAPDETPGGPTA